jgi:ABC-type sulfate transport system substrate-binding protein
MQMHLTRKQTMSPPTHFMNVSMRLAVAVALAGSAMAALAHVAAAKDHFADGAVFDQIYTKK